MNKKIYKIEKNGFSLLELLVTLSMTMILATISVPSFAKLYGQMQASDEVRRLTFLMSELRGEAIRMRTNVRIRFNSTGYSWDIDDNGSTEGSRLLMPTSSWIGGTPSDIVFNGLGVARGVGVEVTISIKNRNTTLLFSVNSNGYINV